MIGCIFGVLEGGFREVRVVCVFFFCLIIVFLCFCFKYFEAFGWEFRRFFEDF